MKLNIQIKKIQPGLYIANCRNLRGCFVQGHSEDEVTKRISEAVKLMVHSYKQHFEKVPFEK